MASANGEKHSFSYCLKSDRGKKIGKNGTSIMNAPIHELYVIRYVIKSAVLIEIKSDKSKETGKKM